MFQKSATVKSVLRIRDILVLIRIWIRGSIPLTNGCVPDPANFVSGRNLKKFTFFYFLLFEATLHHFSKIKGHK
jgi:hypothetical protein